MSSIAQIIKEINALTDYVATQRDNGRDIPAALMHKQAHGFKQKIGKLPDLDAADCNELVAALASDLFAPCAREELEGALMSKLAGSATSKGPSDTKAQKFQSITHAFSQRLWTYWEESGDDVVMKTMALVEALNHMGVTRASEELAGVCASIIACAAMRNPQMPLTSLHALCKHIKEHVAELGVARPCAYGFIHDYPKSMGEFERLHPELYAHAFAADPHVPCPMLSVIDQVASQKFRRGSALGLKCERGAIASRSSASGSSALVSRPSASGSSRKIGLQVLPDVSRARSDQDQQVNERIDRMKGMFWAQYTSRCRSPIAKVHPRRPPMPTKRRPSTPTVLLTRFGVATAPRLA